jgi:hypothetical protein
MATDQAETALAASHTLPDGKDAAIIGQLSSRDQHVVLQMELGGVSVCWRNWRMILCRVSAEYSIFTSF